jgi:hypothetical protein
VRRLRSYRTPVTAATFREETPYWRNRLLDLAGQYPEVRTLTVADPDGTRAFGPSPGEVICLRSSNGWRSGVLVGSEVQAAVEQRRRMREQGRLVQTRRLLTDAERLLADFFVGYPSGAWLLQHFPSWDSLILHAYIKVFDSDDPRTDYFRERGWQVTSVQRDDHCLLTRIFDIKVR